MTSPSPSATPGGSGTPAGAAAPAGSAAPAAPAQPTTSGPPAKLAAAAATALQAALAAEQVAVWAYDLVAAYDTADADIIATIRAGHLARQGATASLLVGGGAAAPDPAAAYSLPKPVTDAASARALTAIVENDCGQAWRAVIGSTDSGSLRTAGLAGLSDSAVWLTTLKLAAKANPATVAFPGQP